MLVGASRSTPCRSRSIRPSAAPSIAIDAFYPGASAETVENSVVQIIEQKMTGFDKLLYMSATSDASGAGRIELTFAAGTDPDLALGPGAEQAPARHGQSSGRRAASGRKGQQVHAKLPDHRRLDLQTTQHDAIDLRDYAQANVEKVLARVPGVGEVRSLWLAIRRCGSG